MDYSTCRSSIFMPILRHFANLQDEHTLLCSDTCKSDTQIPGYAFYSILELHDTKVGDYQEKV